MINLSLSVYLLSMLCTKLSKVPPGHGCSSGLFVSDSVAETGGYKEKVINHRDEKVNLSLPLSA